MSEENNSLDNNEQLKEMVRRMGEFIAYFEIAESSMLKWKKELEAALTQHQRHISKQLSDINKATSELKDIITEAGAARWRIAAEKLLTDGQEHIKSIEKSSHKHIHSLNQTSERLLGELDKKFNHLDQVCRESSRQIEKSVTVFDGEHLKNLSEQSRNEIKETSSHALKSFQRMANRFQWKSIALVCSLVLVVSLIVGLYLNDEMPWEIHHQVTLERNAGQALISAWPSLNPEQRASILAHAHKNLNLK